MKRFIFKIISICILIVAVGSVSACTNNIEFYQDDTKGTMRIDFGEEGMIRNGSDYYSYHVKEGERGILSFRIDKESGKLNINVHRVGNEDDPDYIGVDLDSASFDVIVKAPGDYSICFTTCDFIGDYGINYKTEDASDK